MSFDLKSYKLLMHKDYAAGIEHKKKQ